MEKQYIDSEEHWFDSIQQEIDDNEDYKMDMETELNKHYYDEMRAYYESGQ